jgi:large subunit ribosomal protein L4
MKAVVVNKENKKIEDIQIPESVFGVKWNSALVHQALCAFLGNTRQNLAHTKGRGEVAGGGKKPYAQKHTGRARASSIRSPLWIGGGVTFGPTKERDFTKKINKKMKRLALFSLLSKKMKDGEIVFVDSLALETPKTKAVVRTLDTIFGDKKKSVLIIPERVNTTVARAGKNIEKTRVMKPDALNVYECLSHKYILIEKSAVSEFEVASKEQEA